MPYDIQILNIPTNAFIGRLNELIEIGNYLQLTFNDDSSYRDCNNRFSSWDAQTRDFLIQSVNIASGSDYGLEYINLNIFLPASSQPMIETLKGHLNYKIEYLKRLISRVGTFNSDDVAPIVPSITPIDFTQIFIVHGHDDPAKQKVARFVEKLGFKPIILHEQSNSGKTIIEKIEEYTNVGFAIIIYTPCDIGGINKDNLQPRSRQNVIFEHGYLIGKIGRQNVCALVKGQVETPSDISGVIYTSMDENDAWHMHLARELRSSHYPVDMNKL